MIGMGGAAAGAAGAAAVAASANREACQSGQKGCREYDLSGLPFDGSDLFFVVATALVLTMAFRVGREWKRNGWTAECVIEAGVTLIAGVACLIVAGVASIIVFGLLMQMGVIG